MCFSKQKKSETIEPKEDILANILESQKKLFSNWTSSITRYGKFINLSSNKFSSFTFKVTAHLLLMLVVLEIECPMKIEM